MGASGPNGLDRGLAGQKFESASSGGGDRLHLGSLAVPLNGRSKLKCAMLGEPGGQVEFVWYLNNSLNERRVLFTTTAASSSSWPLGSLTSGHEHHDDNDDNLIDAPERAQPAGTSAARSRTNWRRHSNNNNTSGDQLDPRRTDQLATLDGKWTRWRLANGSTGSGGNDRAARHLDSSVTRAAAAAPSDERDQHLGGQAHVAVSQLELNIETQSDYGQLFCVAKNSIGEQKRACVYTIEPPPPTMAPSDELASQALSIPETNNNNDDGDNSQATLFDGGKF